MIRCVAMLVVLLLPAFARAQQPPLDRFGVAVGGRLVGPAGLSSRPATVTTPNGSSVTLFTTNTELATATDFEGRVGVRLWRWLHAEMIGAIGFARLVTHIADDLENADDVELSESIRQLTLGGALVAELSGLGGSRVVPFVTAGGGYLQPLHGGRPLVDAGRTLHAGGGLHFVFRTGTGWTGRQTALGLRTDVRVDIRDGGIVLDADSHTALSAGALLFYRF